MTTNISMLAVDLSKGSFQVCAVGSDGTVQYNRALSRARFSALLANPASLRRGEGGVRDIASLGSRGAEERV